MTKPTHVPGFPAVPKDVSPETRNYLAKLAEALEIRLGRKGDPKDRAVTLRELLASGLAIDLKSIPFNINNTGDGTDFGPSTPETDTTVPPAPTNLTANGAYSIIILTWDAATFSNYAFTEVWAHDTNSLGDAQLIGAVNGFTYIDPVGSDASRYYWVRHVSTSAVTGPYNNTTGTLGETATDVAYQLNVLANAITSSELAQSLAEPIALIPDLETFTGYDSTYTGDSLLTRMGAVETTANGAATSAQLSAESTTRANADSALTTDITNLQASVGSNSAAISNESITRANADSSLSSQISNVSSTVNGHTTSISTNATSISGLQGQYSVKIDSNGHVAGFGLSSTTTGATPTSAFIVRADKFAVIDPADTGDGLGTTTPSSDNVPFFIYNGDTYLKSAMIQDASITNAKIGNLGADKITTGTLSADRIGAGSVGVNKLNLVGTGATINLASAASGGRMVIQGTKILVYDTTGALRVKIGDL